MQVIELTYDLKSCEKSLTPISYLEKTPLVSRLREEAGLGITWNLKDLKTPHQESVSEWDFSWASAEILLMGLCLKERILERELSKFHRFFDSLACPLFFHYVCFLFLQNASYFRQMGKTSWIYLICIVVRKLERRKMSVWTSFFKI